MNFTKTMFALAIGSIGIMNAASSNAATLYTGEQLTITAGVKVFDSSGGVESVTNSWFGIDGNGDGSISGYEKTPLAMGTTGIFIGTTTTAGASHSGVPTAGDTNAITAPWAFFGDTGSDYTTVGITGGTGGMNMSGWTVTWNGIPAINMGGGAWGTGFSNGVGNFAWDGIDGHAYTLDYHATVPLGDPTGFGGVPYSLHLQGCVLENLESVCMSASTPTPEASTCAMMLAGLGLVGFAARRRSLKTRSTFQIFHR